MILDLKDILDRAVQSLVDFHDGPLEKMSPEEADSLVSEWKRDGQYTPFSGDDLMKRFNEFVRAERGDHV